MHQCRTARTRAVTCGGATGFWAVLSTESSEIISNPNKGGGHLTETKARVACVQIQLPAQPDFDELQQDGLDNRVIMISMILMRSICNNVSQIKFMRDEGGSTNQSAFL